MEELSKMPLSGVEAKKYRGGAARFNYLAQDRADVGFIAKELARGMASPSEADMCNLKKAVRYLKFRPRALQLYRWQDPQVELTCEVDADWAGCVKTRRSTSGGVLRIGRHVIAHWSRTQPVVALSSGEAELNASLKGGCEVLGANELLNELGQSYKLQLLGDSTACKGVLHREGVGRLKHISVKQLWLQERVNTGQVAFAKIRREVNSADALTHNWQTKEQCHFSRMDLYPLPA